MKSSLSLFICSIVIMFFIGVCYITYNECELSERQFNNVLVDVNLEDEGIVTTFSNVKIDYLNGTPTHIKMDKNVLLSYNSPRKYIGGVVIMSGEDLNRLRISLEENNLATAKNILKKLQAIESIPT